MYSRQQASSFNLAIDFIALKREFTHLFPFTVAAAGQPITAAV